MRTMHYLVPYIAFAVFLTVQLIVVAAFIPETKGKPLPEELPYIDNDVTEGEQMHEMVPSRRSSIDV